MADEARIDEFNHWAAKNGWRTRADARPVFQSTKLQDCLAAWTKACDGKPFPPRAALTPRAMKSFLTHVLVWDVLRGGDGAIRFRIRVIGTEPERLWGGRPGDLIAETVPEPFRTRWQKLAMLSLSICGPLRIHGPIQYGGQIYFEGEGFVAPLACNGGEPDAVMIVLIVKPSTDVARPDAATRAL